MAIASLDIMYTARVLSRGGGLLTACADAGGDRGDHVGVHVVGGGALLPVRRVCGAGLSLRDPRSAAPLCTHDC